MLTTLLRASLLAVLSTSLAMPAMAQDDKRASREREALRRAQQQVQKSTQDLSALQQKFDAAEQERAKLADEGGGAQTQFTQTGTDGTYSLARVPEGPHVLNVVQQHSG